MLKNGRNQPENELVLLTNYLEPVSPAKQQSSDQVKAQLEAAEKEKEAKRRVEEEEKRKRDYGKIDSRRIEFLIR